MKNWLMRRLVAILMTDERVERIAALAYAAGVEDRQQEIKELLKVEAEAWKFKGNLTRDEFVMEAVGVGVIGNLTYAIDECLSVDEFRRRVAEREELFICLNGK